MLPFLFRRFRSLETKVHELNYLFWECTQRCNLACRHCGSDCFTSAKDQDMPLEDFLKALDTIPNPGHSEKQPASGSQQPESFNQKSGRGKAGSQRFNTRRLTVVLTGGEPLLRPDIDRIGKEIRRRGHYWSMVSNGFFYTEEMHRRLMAAGMNALTISLDGIGDVHNWMRGNPKSYDNAIRAISIAAKERRLDFDVVTCVNKRNLPQMEEIYSTLLSLGVKRWRIFTIIPIGRATQEPDLHLSNQEMVQLMDFIAAKRSKPKHSPTPANIHNTNIPANDAKTGANSSGRPAYMEVTFSCEGYLGKYEEKVRPVRFFCHAGINIASVLIDGSICACPNIDRELFSQGNIYRDNLYEVWENKFQVFRNRNWAKKGICSRCPQFKNCLGGGMHNWHSSQDSNTLNELSSPESILKLSELKNPLSCHYRRTNT